MLATVLAQAHLQDRCRAGLGLDLAVVLPSILNRPVSVVVAVALMDLAGAAARRPGRPMDVLVVLLYLSDPLAAQVAAAGKLTGPLEQAERQELAAAKLFLSPPIQSVCHRAGW